MTAAAADRPTGRLAQLAHYPVLFAIALFLLDVATRLPDVHGVLGVALGVPCIVVFLIYGYAMVQHDRARLCDKCSEGAPLDPQAAVTEKRRWLKLTHCLTDTRLRWAPLVLMFVLLGLGAIGIGEFRIGEFRLTLVSPLFWLVMLGPAMLLQVHTPLQPWCPFCRWGRGEGPEEPSPEPTPDPSDAPERDTVVS